MTNPLIQAAARLGLDDMDPAEAARIGHDMSCHLFGNRAFADTLAERLDQIFRHGFDADHDRAHAPQDLPLAALTYLEDAIHQLLGRDAVLVPSPDLPREIPSTWPFRDFFRPADPRANLVKAAAFIFAAIDRLDNAPADATEGDDE